MSREDGMSASEAFLDVQAWLSVIEVGLLAVMADSIERNVHVDRRTGANIDAANRRAAELRRSFGEDAASIGLHCASEDDLAYFRQQQAAHLDQLFKTLRWFPADAPPAARRGLRLVGNDEEA